jgi:DNA-binding transcriptional MerR regulator
MSRFDPNAALPPIPAKRYFTIGEVSELTLVKPHVLRYWEQEFTQLKPLKRRGNRRYYQHHEVLLVRRIRELLYEQGFTISGARNRLDHEGESAARNAPLAPVTVLPTVAMRTAGHAPTLPAAGHHASALPTTGHGASVHATSGNGSAAQHLSVAAGGGAAMTVAYAQQAPQPAQKPLTQAQLRSELLAIRAVLLGE